MSRKRANLKFTKERAVLSDILPYEVPITFSNRHFYHFLQSNNIEYRNNCIYWNEDDATLDETIKLIFGLSQDSTVIKEKTSANGRLKTVCKIENLNGKKLVSIPFGFKINHKANSFRDLAVCHPKNQLLIVEFYSRFKELILYYCNLSPFSIRRPQKVAKYIFHKDKTHYDLLSKDNTGIEEHDLEYENLRSYFVYKDYSNIYKFFESYTYHRCEKKYNALTRLDITKCFDSMYTHTLPWALFNKESVKENIKQANETFPGLFDRLMQQLNYNETNGIIIGPEFSRIFAELLLQTVDSDVKVDLSSKYGLTHKKHYQVFRYVDDYFIFYNDAYDKEKIIEQLQVNLRKYNLYLNDSKAVTYTKPIITEITMAKQRVASLLQDKLAYKLDEFDLENSTSPLEKPVNKVLKGSIAINSKTLIVQFKTIIKECGVEYSDILNYSLSVVERKSETIIKHHKLADKQHRSEKQLINAIRDILDFVFFIYSVSPRVNTTIKLSRIIRLFTTYLKGNEINRDFRHLVFKDIYDNIYFILDKNERGEYSQVETLYLLVSMAELGKDYWIDSDSLARIFGLIEGDSNIYKCKYDLNYFSITVLLFYMKDKKRYNNVRSAIEAHILARFEENKTELRIKAELIFLLMDCLTCPYLSRATKDKLLMMRGISDPAMQSSLIEKARYWFTKWDNFNLGKELDAKQSQEVY